MKQLFAVLLTCLFAGCATVDIKDYAAEQPKLDLKQYFNGTIDGWGMVQDRSGKVTRRFHVVIDAKWNADTGVLDESFQWSDGKTEKRIWTIKKNGDQYVGTAGDVVGTAAGEAVGNALRWKYVLALPVDGRALAAEPSRYRDALADAARQAERGGAQALILGGAAFAGLARLVDTPLPVIDAIDAATAALLARLA